LFAFSFVFVFRLDAVANNYMRVSSLENRLTSIQQKLDNITDLLSSYLATWVASQSSCISCSLLLNDLSVFPSAIESHWIYLAHFQSLKYMFTQFNSSCCAFIVMVSNEACKKLYIMSCDLLSFLHCITHQAKKQQTCRQKHDLTCMHVQIHKSVP